MPQYGGWTGKTLRVDLTTGSITTEDTIAKYKDYIGGLGLGLKVLWDEVPAGTKAFDPANRLIFAVGPLTGTGTPLSGRTTIVSLWPVHPEELPASGHMGGHWGAELKYAGWDAIILQGKASKPSWLYIKDDVVEIRDAGKMWGNGIFRANSDIMDIMGPDAKVAAIGQCGENLVRVSNIMNGRSHSAGGLGGVMGSKNLKAIGVIGTGSVKVSASKAAWKELVQYQHTILGANSGGVVPRTLQSWQPDGYTSNTRWSARKGLYWGAATPPVDTGDCSAYDVNSIGLRTHKGHNDFSGGVVGGVGDKRTVKIGGCFSCPIRCHIAVDIPALEQYGVSRYQVNTCNGNSSSQGFLTNTSGNLSNLPAGETNITGSYLGVALADDYGFWSDYGMIQATFKYLYNNVVTDVADPYVGKKFWEKYLSAAEYAKVPWTLLNPQHPAAQTGASDLNFIPQLTVMIANNLMADGTQASWEKIQASALPIKTHSASLGALLALGPGRLALLIPELAAEYASNSTAVTNHINKGFIKHHFTESTGMGQVSALINMSFNRDPQCHTHTNFQGNGLPRALQNQIFNELFAVDGADGSDAIHNARDTVAVTKSMVVFAKMSLLYLELHNSLTICNYTLPGWASPRKERTQNGVPYIGDAAMDAKMYSAVTGETVTRRQLEDMGLRIFSLFRALNARYMNQINQRVNHDILPEWSFKAKAGNTLLVKADMETAKDMLYTELGWDKTTGMPTRATFERLNMKAVADELASKGLLP